MAEERVFRTRISARVCVDFVPNHVSYARITYIHVVEVVLRVGCVRQGGTHEHKQLRIGLAPSRYGVTKRERSLLAAHLNLPSFREGEERSASGGGGQR